MTVSVRAAVDECACPACGTFSRRVQSRYWRRVADLPLAGRRVDLVVLMRRLWCDAMRCWAGAGSFRSSLLLMFSHHGHGAQVVWINSSIILAWRWAAGPPQALPRD